MRVHLTERVTTPVDADIGPPMATKATQNRLSIRFLRSSEWSLNAIRTLRTDKESLIVLFTPVVPPVEGTASSGPDDTSDPFESMVVALSKHHPRIRHVPFVPKVGLTETHLAWIRRADAIVTVNCEITASDGLSPDQSVKNQASFATAVADAMHTMRADSDEVSLTCAYCGQDQPAMLSDYENMLLCPDYRQTHLEQAAGLLLGGDV